MFGSVGKTLLGCLHPHQGTWVQIPLLIVPCYCVLSGRRWIKYFGLPPAWETWIEFWAPSWLLVCPNSRCYGHLGGKSVDRRSRFSLPALQNRSVEIEVCVGGRGKECLFSLVTKLSVTHVQVSQLHTLPSGLSSLLMPVLGDMWCLKEFGFLPLTWETWIEFLVPGFSPAYLWLLKGSWEIYQKNGDSVCCSLSASPTNK